MSQEIWNDAAFHQDPEQQKRQKSACDKKLTPINIADGVGRFKGSARAPYETSLSTCTCADFIRRKLPCKHMYRLAHELEVFKLVFTVNNSEFVLFETGKVNIYVDKSTGEFVSCIDKNSAIESLNILSDIALGTLQNILYYFIYQKHNGYFIFDKQQHIATELIASKIILSAEFDTLSKLDYAGRSDLLSIIDSIGSEKFKTLNPKAIAKTIRNFMKNNLNAELNKLSENIFVLVPNPLLQQYYISIYRAIFKMYTDTEFCYDCYLKENGSQSLDQNTYVFSNQLYCPTCHNICEGLIRLLKR